MGNFIWTAEQLEAVTARDSNLLVAAAAGTGKTAVLVERVIRRVLDEGAPVDLDRLLIVTFTRAAAAEMRERINSALISELNQNPSSEHLNRQLLLLPQAAISTLHSFCLEVLRRYFYRLDLDPAFRVAEDTEAALMRLETLEQLLEDYYTAGAGDFLALVDAYGGDRGDLELQEIVLNLHQFAVSNPWPETWLWNLGRDYTGREDLALDQTAWGQIIKQSLELELRGGRAKLARAAELAASPKGPQVYQADLKQDLALVDGLLEAAAGSWQDLDKVINSAEFGKLKACRDKEVNEDLKKRVQALRDEVKQTVNAGRDSFFSRPQAELVTDLKKIAPLVETLAGLVIEFNRRYRRVKASRAVLDFADLEQYCLQILMGEASLPGQVVPSPIAGELREHFAEVLVDEYQDINGVQEAILQLVSREGTTRPNRFMVGDVKQSIYRFRLAEPALFLAKYRTYPKAEGLPERGLDLTRNFRSRQEIVNTVNFIFRQLMTARVGELSYEPKAELVFGADYPPDSPGLTTAGGPTELYLVEKGAVAPADYGNSNEEDQADLDAVRQEARLVAGRIRRMTGREASGQGPEFQVRDQKTGTFRPVCCRDIVVLLRVTRNTANIFLEELRLAGIPAYAELGTGYFEAVEVETMMSLLKVIDNPRQDIPLAAVLRSPVIGLDAEELAAVRLQERAGELCEAVKKSAGAAETGVALKLRGFLERLGKWRTMARQGPLTELIWRLYNETGYYAYVGGLPNGAQRQANLRALHDRARQYETTAFRGLFQFLRFIENLQESGGDLGTARVLGENEDVVRVLSIHKSKGLEFPVVVVAGLGKPFNTGDLKKKALIHRELGLGLPVVEINRSLTYPSIAWLAVKKQLHLELLAEEMRILYVALTRAREKLILAGSAANLEKAAVRWCENVGHTGWPLPDHDLAAAKTYLDWICPAVARHPDGEPLRKLAGCLDLPGPPTAGDPSGWQVHLTGPGRLQPPEQLLQDKQGELLELVRRFQPVPAEGKYSETLNNSLNWQYPSAEVAGKPAKTSVTEIKRQFAGEFTDPQAYSPWTTERSTLVDRPVFIQPAAGLSAAERGAAMHLVMQHLKLDGDLAGSGFGEQLQTMVARELLTKEQAESVDLSAIQHFFRTPLGQRLVRAPRVHKEVPFTMAVPARKAYPDLVEDYGEQVLVQGVIDCLLEEEDGFVIIDYKTDEIRAGQLAEVVQRYQGQLNLYTLAVETILRRPVKEKYLYLFALGREIKCG